MLAYSKPFFNTDEGWQDFYAAWQHLIRSNIEDEYTTNLISFKKRYSDFPLLLSYLETTWLIYYRKFIRAWSGQYMHLNNVASSRVEGAHSMLKKHIGTSAGDLLITYDRISTAINMQLSEIALNTAEDKIKIILCSRNSLYAHIIRRISRASIKLIDSQRYLANQVTPEHKIGNCTNHFTRTMGLPCKHRLADLIRLNQPIPLADIHPFWRIGLDSSNTPYLPLLDPRVPVPKPKRSDKSSQASGNSGGDSGGGGTKKKAPSRCSKCGEVGHTYKKCLA